MARRLAVCAVLFACMPAAQVHAAIVQQVQSGTKDITGASGTTAVAISSVDMTKSVLIFQARSNSAEPGTSEVRGRLASSTSIEFVRVSDNSPAVTVTVQWYLATFGSGVFVQRGETTQSAATVNIAITSVTSMSQAFVLFSKTPASADTVWNGEDAVLAELTSATQVTFRSNALNAGHTIAWQVVQFTNGATDINVQKGSTSMVGGSLTATATLSPAVNVNKTFVLAGIRTTDGTVTDIGARMVKAILTNSTTITFERSIAGTSDITEIVWQAVELKDASIVWRGNATFAAAGATATAVLSPTVNVGRAVAFISTQNGGGQNMGKSPYAGNVLGVATATAVLTATDQITLTRNNTASSAELGWFVVQFDGGVGLKVGSFTKTATVGPVTQVIAHGLGQVPKAIIMWTEGRPDETFSSQTGIAFRAAAQATAATGVLTLTINKPAGTVVNDVMVASIGVSQAVAATITAPAGWVLAPNGDVSTAGPTANALGVYYKVAGTAEPASYAFTFSASTGSAGGIQSFSGVDVSDPVDVDRGQATTSALTHAALAVTTTLLNDMVVTSHTFSSSATWNPPSGMTEAIDATSIAAPNAGGQSIEANYELKATAGSTGTDTATAVSPGNGDAGNTHTLALRALSQAYFGFGMTDGTTSRSISAASVHGGNRSNSASQLAAKALTIGRWNTATGGMTLAEADLQSWDSTNFTLNWTTNNANQPYIIHYIAIGGSSVLAKVLPWTTGTVVNAALGITGVGFQPAVVLTAHASYLQTAAPPTTALATAGFGLGAMDGDGRQWANGFFSTDDAGTSNTQRGQRTDAFLYSFNSSVAVQKKASWVSMDADGFTVNVSNATSGNDTQVISLALTGLNAQVGSFNKSTGVAPVDNPIAGVNFQPHLVLLTSVQDLTQAGSATAHTRFGIGASDGTTDGSSAFTDTNGVGTTSVFGIDKTSKVFVKTNTNASTFEAEADLKTMNPDGFTLNWTTNDAVATEMLYLALAPIAITEVRLTSFTAARYDRGVLLQWRTGYEIDNLGFNVYREINGVRTKLNTLGLIAGSGLQAGQGGVVRAEQAYARWDLDAAAGDPTVTYWLEDVEFNGKITEHGPATPVARELQEPATVDSVALSEIGAASARQIFFAYNPDPVQAGPRAVAAEAPPEVTTQWALAAQPAVKLGIRKPGWYRVTRDALVGAGLDPLSDPQTLQLFVNGTEQAIRVTGAIAGSFDAIEFYGAGVDTAYTDTRIYWLQAGGAPGRRIVVATGEAAAPVTTTGFASTVRRKDRSVYWTGLLNGDTENWFGPPVLPFFTAPPGDDPWAAAVFTFTPDHLDRAAGTDAQLTVVLQGVSTGADGNGNHQVGVMVNGTSVGEVTFVGQDHPAQTFPVALGLLADGANTVTLEARGGDADSSLTDAITLTYPHTYQADADRLKFTVAGPAAITVGAFAGSAIRVFDITDRSMPIQLPAAIGTDPSGSTVTVQVAAEGLRTLLAFSDETVAAPAFVETNHPSTLHAATNAHDYVIVSHADFLTQMAPLAALRQQQGHAAVVVDIADVYDEFSFGEKTPQALRDFLQWAQTHRATPPRFVVLAGDATTDPRDYAGFGPADFVPTKQVPMHKEALETASDDWFVDFKDDGLPTIAIGRLSMRTSAQASAVVGKIVGYDQPGAAAWTKNVLLVADQNGAAANFEHMSTALSALVPAPYQVQTVFRGVLGDAPAHQALTDAVNAGQFLVNYSGHGSTYLWGGNGQLLTTDDVPTWVNGPRLPFVVAMNCLNGFFSNIYGEESLAEALLRAPQGGAVAVWASSSLTAAATQALVNEELFRLIFAGTYASVGEAVAMAKRVVSDQELRRSWIFFGDPAMHLRGAPQAPTLRTLGAPPAITTQPQGASIAAGQQATLSVIAMNPSPLEYQWYARTSRTTMSPIAGATGSHYTTDPMTATVSYMVRVSNASGTTESAVAVLSTPPMITTTNPWPAATARIAYTLALTASNSAMPYQWAATGLPSGLTLDADSGEIFDAPNGAGTFTFTIQVTGADGVSAQQAFTLTVNAASDVLLDQQWHLQARQLETASADVVPVWLTTRGAGVVIGIVDDGVQSTHPDLQGNYVAALSYDFRDHDADASPVMAGACDSAADCQGTAVAGIAAARGDNGYGGSGVAPLASLAGIRLAAHGADSDEAAAFAHQGAAVAIENHSWHRADDGQSVVAPGPLAEAALASAIAQGRVGAGRIFVWAAGDGRARGDNCNFDGYATSRFGIAVGAVDDTGQAAPYSEACSALLVSAPSSGAAGHRSLTTTDLVDADGFAAGDDTDAFGGTAAAAPVVSGVVALMLARNPALTWRDVQHILVRTSRPVAATDASWTLGPFPHSEQYGFGVVDALAAVTRAATWIAVAPEQAVTPVTHAVGALIPDDTGAGVSDAITISAGTRVSVEHVEVEFTAAHPHRGDLEVTLTSPAGVVSVLGPARPGDGGADFTGWRFRSVRHWGESAAGMWTLTVTDRAAGHVGVFTGWTLRLFGAALPTVPHAAAHDYDGDGTADLMVYRPAAGTWFRRLASTHFTDGTATAFGRSGDVPVAGDYDGDGTIDEAVYRPAAGRWFIQPSGGGAVLSYAWGLRTDVPTPGDYDGDGRTDVAVYRPATGSWMIRRSSDDAVVTIRLGLRTDLPVPADYDGDGTTDLAIYRPATGIWSLLMSSEGATTPRTIQWGLRGDVPVPGDYDGDGLADLAVYRPASGTWFLRPSATLTAVTVQWGVRTDVPVPADYDGNGTIDVAVFRPATGMWYLRPSTTDAATSRAVQWGLAGDIPAPNATVAYGMTLLRRSSATRARTADLDGDGQADFTVFRPSSGTWYTRLSAAGTTAFQWGLAGDIPVPEDYDGDGTMDRAVYRPATGVWYLRLSTTNFAASSSFQWGVSGDVPVPGDYDGDGIADVAVFRPATGTWYIRQSSTNFATSVSVQWGLSGDVPVPGDYDGDGVVDLAIFRPSTGVWHIRPSSTPDTATTRQWGLGSDIPVPGDYDGDGRTDLAVYRPSTGVWWLLPSNTNFTTVVTVQWGLSNDLPVPGDYDGDGTTDLAVWRPADGVWYVLLSSTGFTASSSVQWGLAGDIAISTIRN